MRFEPFSPLLLKSIRKEKKLTQHDLAKVSGVPKDTLALYEQGKVNPSEKQMGKLGKALELYFFADWPEDKPDA